MRSPPNAGPWMRDGSGKTKSPGVDRDVLLYSSEASFYLLHPPKKICVRLCVFSTNLGFSGVVKTLLLSHATTV